MKNFLFLIFCAWASIIPYAAYGQNEPISDYLTEKYYGEDGYKSTYILVNDQPMRLRNGLCLGNRELSCARIHDQTLSRMDFSGSRLDRANLERTQFKNCSFRGVILDGANVSGSTFDDCNFEDASFNNVRNLQLTREQFKSSSHMKSKELSDFTFQGKAKIKDIDYSNFKFRNVKLLCADGCDFENAVFLGDCSVYNMTKEQLVSTQNYKVRSFPDSLSLSGNNFGKEAKINLAGLDLSNQRIKTLSCLEYDLSGVDFTDAAIEDCMEIFSCSGLTKEQIQSTENWKCRRFNFALWQTRVDWQNVDFSNFTFPPSSRLEGDVTDANFAGAKIEDAHALKYCKGLTLRQLFSTWNWSHKIFPFDLDEQGIDWSYVDFSNFTFVDNFCLGKDSDVTGANFTDAKFIGQSLLGLNLKDWKGLTVEQIKSTWNYKTNNMSGLLLPPEIQQQLDEEANATQNGEAVEAK